MIIYVLLYRLSVALYAFSVRIASLFRNKARLFIAGRRGWQSKMEAALVNETRGRIWMHCASLGEFEQGRPLIEKLRLLYPEYALVITFFSPSGYEIRKNYEGADYVYYLPIDSHANARQFLDMVQPQLCVFIKYELWYYYLSAIKKRQIPALLVSAIFRPEQSFFKWYGRLQRFMLGCFTHIFVQDAQSLQLLNKIGINTASISGDTRFDRVIEIAQQEKNISIAASFCRNNKVIIAGSTWPGDEEFLQKVFTALQELSYKLIIVPHEVHPAHIKQIEQTFKDKTITWSNYTYETDKQVLIADKIGFLSALYKYAHVAWIGGGFGKAGIHNALEAAVYGIPCLYGPIYYQFAEAVALIEAGGAVSLKTPEEFVSQMQQWGDMDSYGRAAISAKQFVYSHQGATQVVLDYISSQSIIRISDKV